MSDITPPGAPFDVRAVANPDGTITIAWEAEADLESGLRGFVIRRDGVDLVTLPEKSVERLGRPLFQNMSYHDTPEKPLPQMSFTDASASPGTKHRYEILAVNSAGIRSRPAKVNVLNSPRAAAGRGQRLYNSSSRSQ